MAKYFLIATLAFSAVTSQDRYWGSYSAVYPAGGSGSSAEVAYDVAKLQEESRQSLTAAAPRVSAPQTSASRVVPSPAQPQSFGIQASRPGGYVHNPTGDAGQPYVHDTSGDHGPYYYWKLRNQGQATAQAAPALPVPAPAPTPQRRVVSVRKQRPIQPAFENFQPTPTAQAAPAQQQYFQPARAPAPALAPVAPASNFFQAQVPEYQNNFAQRAYSYTAPLYSASAQGTSYTYSAQY